MDDPYLWLQGAVYDETPDYLKPLVNQIKRKSEWEKLLNIKLEEQDSGEYGGFTIEGINYWFNETDPDLHNELDDLYDSLT